MPILWAVNAALVRLAKGCVVGLTAVMLGSISLQIVTRLAIGRSPPWTEEVALLAFAWIVLLMIAVGVREGAHVRIDAAIKVLPDPAARAAERLIELLIAGTGAYLVWASLGYIDVMRGSTSAAIRYPLELLYLSLPVFGTLTVLFALENVVRGAAAQKADAP